MHTNNEQYKKDEPSVVSHPQCRNYAFDYCYCSHKRLHASVIKVSEGLAVGFQCGWHQGHRFNSDTEAYVLGLPAVQLITLTIATYRPMPNERPLH